MKQHNSSIEFQNQQKIQNICLITAITMAYNKNFKKIFVYLLLFTSTQNDMGIDI